MQRGVYLLALGAILARAVLTTQWLCCALPSLRNTQHPKRLLERGKEQRRDQVLSDLLVCMSTACQISEDCEQPIVFDEPCKESRGVHARVLWQVTRLENGLGAFLSWVLTDELILSLQCGACYLHSRCHALKCSCHLRQRRSISSTHPIRIVDGEDGLGSTISLKLDL